MIRTTGNGRLTADPELRTTTSGKSVCTFRIGTKDRETQYFFDCVAWGTTAETIAKYMHKGDQIIIEVGRLTNREYTDKKGNKVKTHDIVVDNFEFGAKAARNDTKADDPMDDFEEAQSELPF